MFVKLGACDHLLAKYWKAELASEITHNPIHVHCYIVPGYHPARHGPSHGHWPGHASDQHDVTVLQFGSESVLPVWFAAQSVSVHFTA